MLEIDFVLRTSTATVTPTSINNVNDSATAGAASSHGAALASEVLRFQRAGDSVVLLEYTGTVRGRLQYRRRDVMPILGVTPAQGLIVDATPVWAVVKPRAAREMGWPAGPSLEVHTADPPRSEAAAVRSRDPQVIGTQLSILRLPKQPMQARLADPRIPFDVINTEEGKSYICRWRLEKKDPTAQVSDVVQPIVVRLAESVPAAWVPHIRRSVTQWNPVFEAIGYRNAIVVRLAAETPVTEREIVIKWNSLSQIGGGTNTTSDPRTGEILKGDITLSGRFPHRQSRTALLSGAADPRTPMPFPDSLLSILYSGVIAHEMGHALGLDHNKKGSGVYPTDSLRQPSFLRRMGSSASVMAYADVNYVAQPEDGVSLQDRVIRIGPYDRWAINWGYRPIPGATTPEAEQPILEQWRAAQDTVPYLQASLGVELDPSDKPQTMGDDQLKSTDYGFRNLTRLTAALDPKRDTVVEIHPRPFDIARMWNLMLSLVANVVGGVTPRTPYPADLAKLQLQPVDSARQVQAMQFVLAHLFYGQDELVSKYVLGTSPRSSPPTLVLFDSVTYGWYPKQWQGFQAALVTDLVGRITRLSRSSRLSWDRVGTRAALCQKLAALKEQLSAAAESTARSSEHAKGLLATVTPAFDSGGGCR